MGMAAAAHYPFIYRSNAHCGCMYGCWCVLLLLGAALQEVASLTNALAHTEWHRFQFSNGEDVERRQTAIACFQQCLTILRICVGELHPAAQKVQRELDFAMKSAA